MTPIRKLSEVRASALRARRIATLLILVVSPALFALGSWMIYPPLPVLVLALYVFGIGYALDEAGKKGLEQVRLEEQAVTAATTNPASSTTNDIN